MHTGGSSKTEQINAQSRDAKEGDKSILNIREAHDQDKINARSLGFSFNPECNYIDVNNLQNSFRDYLQVNNIGTETLSDIFDSLNAFGLDKDAKSDDQQNHMESDALLSIVRQNDKPKNNAGQSNISQYMVNDKIDTKSSAQKDCYQTELVAIDDGPNDFKIFSKDIKNKDSQKLSMFESPSNKNQISKLVMKKKIEVSNRILSKKPIIRTKNKKRKFAVVKNDTKTL